jgi:hypothetical protein
VRRFTVLRIALGGLLIAAAGLKLYGLSVSAIPRVGWFSQPSVQLAAVEWELILGLWILSGSYPRMAWLAALGTFAAFAAASGYLGWIGVASCGCFGVIDASPWWAFGVDVTVIGLLLVCRPRTEAALSNPIRHGVPEGLKWVGGAAVLLVGLTVVATLVYDSPTAALARLRGETLAISDPYLDFGTGKPGDTLKASASIRNWSSQPVRIVGGTSDCSCTALADLPLTIEPGGSAAVGIRLIIPASKGGQFSRTVFLRTDCPEQPVVSLGIGCRIE